MCDSGEAFVKSLGITKGLKVLDLGYGDGTTALPGQGSEPTSSASISQRTSSRPGTSAKEAALTNCKFQEGDASNLHQLEANTFDLVVSMFGAMFAPRPFDVAKPAGE